VISSSYNTYMIVCPAEGDTIDNPFNGKPLNLTFGTFNWA